MKLLRWDIMVVVLAATLAACGGGGGAIDPKTTQATASGSAPSDNVASNEGSRVEEPASRATTGNASEDSSLNEEAVEKAFASSSDGAGSGVTAGEKSASGEGTVHAFAVSRSNGSKGCGRGGNHPPLHTLVSDGITREFGVSVPPNYNRYKPYKLIVAFHWAGGNATDVYFGNSWGSKKPFFGLQEIYRDDAIYVAPQGLNHAWPNYYGGDTRFIRSMVEDLKERLCIDTNHVYATGFSYGGMMTYAIGCEMGDIFRAIAPMAGALWTPATKSDVPWCGRSPNTVAAIMFHANEDPVVPIWWGYLARDMILQKNSCSRETVPVGRNGCVLYKGCSRPTVWCEFNHGSHSPPEFSAQETKTFFDIVN